YCIYLQYLLKQMHIPADFFLFVCSYTICKTAYSPADLTDNRRRTTIVTLTVFLCVNLRENYQITKPLLDMCKDRTIVHTKRHNNALENNFTFP
ncbi:hypothetical protein, partial [Prevotella sp.]|uniref:hypothetical protein n=1 Tax=Prevotella sp. TaxID=59823 RepID=UPI0026486A40